MVTVSVLKIGGAAGEQGPAMAAVVGNMDGAAEWQVGGRISDTRCYGRCWD